MLKILNCIKLSFIFMNINLFAQQALENFTFNPLEVKRDPFSPPDRKMSLVDGNELIRYDLFELKLVAVMTGLGASKAMIVLPNGATHIVQQGDRLGRNSGYITDIKMDRLVVLESFKDFRGRVKKNYEVVQLNK